MKRHKWTFMAMLGLAAWLAIASGQARAGVIFPVDPAGKPDLESSVSISIINPTTGADMTDYWLPVPEQTVRIRVNPAGTYDITLKPAVLDPISSGALVTSAYPGRCANFPSQPDDPFDDFTLNGDILTPYDNGGMAVVTVTVGTNTFTFVLPQDDDLDGIPNIYEKQYCPAGDCVRADDIDAGPDTASPTGDGWTNMDEYRGWRVSEEYVRGNPLVKDYFLHLEAAPQCTGTAGSFGSLVDLSFFFGSDLTDLFVNANTLGVKIHPIATDEWVDNFVSYDKDYGVSLNADGPITDRQINKNAIALLEDPASSVVKGVRVIQCLDLKALSPLGLADKNPPNLSYNSNGNAILFIHRIVNSMLNMISAGGERRIKYYTYEGGSWAEKKIFPAPSPIDVNDDSVKSIIKIALAWYFAHEAFEHAFDVTSTAEGTRKVSYGYHHADGSGTNVDVKFVNVVDKKESDFNKFYIPKYHGISDEREMRVLSSQVLSTQ